MNARELASGWHQRKILGQMCWHFQQIWCKLCGDGESWSSGHCQGWTLSLACCPLLTGTTNPLRSLVVNSAKTWGRRWCPVDHLLSREATWSWHPGTNSHPPPWWSKHSGWKAVAGNAVWPVQCCGHPRCCVTVSWVENGVGMAGGGEDVGASLLVTLLPWV